MRPAVVIVCAPLLCACIGVQASQPVTSEKQAIALAQERCSWSRPAGATYWHARLHDGQWHVWLVRDAEKREPAVGNLDIWIRASDGEAGDCNKVR
jgi:hypothetical protein